MIKGVGYIGVGVGAAIFDAQNRLLLTLRGPKAQNERGKWEIPGGRVEYGETCEDAIKREMKEELGLVIKVLDLLIVTSHIIQEEKQHWVSPTYICKIIRGKPKILESQKCSKIGWFTIPDALRLSLSIITVHDIDIIRKKFPRGLNS